MLLRCPPHDKNEHVSDHRNNMQFSVPAALIGRTAFLYENTKTGHIPNSCFLMIISNTMQQ